MCGISRTAIKWAQIAISKRQLTSTIFFGPCGVSVIIGSSRSNFRVERRRTPVALKLRGNNSFALAEVKATVTPKPSVAALGTSREDVEKSMELGIPHADHFLILAMHSIVLRSAEPCYSAWYFRCSATCSGGRYSYSTLSPSRTCRVPSRMILSSMLSPFLMRKRSSNSF
jgi:hypothetical protein